MAVCGEAGSHRSAGCAAQAESPAFRLGSASNVGALRVSPSPDRRRLAEWKPCAGLRAKIQVRPSLQFAWSAVNHKLNYKSPTEVPRKLQRRMFQLSALPGDGAGIEDALTLLIMADQRVAKDIYGKVYSGDWAEFSTKSDAWHTRKRWHRART